jgi:8-oxo-dGTP diphosphatase
VTGRRERAGRHGDGTEIRAAGAVLYRRAEDGVEVALIHRPRHDDWSLPKGKLEPGEHVLLAAVREVTEETGIRPVLGRPLSTVRYQVEGKPKRVDYWAARPHQPGNGTGPGNGPGPGNGTGQGFVPGEVDRLEWLPLPAAKARLTYSHDAYVVENLVSSANGPGTVPDTVPYILLRHASAGRKGAWRGDDLLRPLDARGIADARALADLLACYAPSRVISSAAERCLGTVRPYAERIGAASAAEPAFTVRADGGDRSDAARRRMTELIKQPAPTVICAHRENLPVLLAQAHAELGDPRPRDDWSPPKAGFWVLHVAGGRLAALERHDLSGR